MSDLNNDPEIEIPKVIRESKVTNPLIARARLPGDTFRLPSGGIFYTNGELDDTVEDGEVHVYPMTAIDEIVITSPAKLFSGEGIVEVISRCIPSILQPKELLAQDVDFLLLCLRKVSYGPTFEVERSHWDCKEVAEGEIPRKQIFATNIGEMIAKTKQIDVADINKHYRIEMDNKQIVKMQPMRFSSYVTLMQIMASESSEDLDKKDAAEKTDIMINQLGSMILSVDEIADQDMINEWLHVVTPKDIRTINDGIHKMSKWGIDTTFSVKCRDCKEKMEVEVPTNPLALFS